MNTPPLGRTVSGSPVGVGSWDFITRVMAGTDRGFGTFAAWEMVAESVVWAKLKACSEGARLATQRLWG